MARPKAYAEDVAPLPPQFDVIVPPLLMRRPTAEETQRLAESLRRSGERGMVMNVRDTTFIPDGISVDEYDRLLDAQVVDSVKSIPTHY